MPVANLKPRDFSSQGDSQKALELAEAFNQIEANLETIRAWGVALATKLNGDAGVSATDFVGPVL